MQIDRGVIGNFDLGRHAAECCKVCACTCMWVEKSGCQVLENIGLGVEYQNLGSEGSECYRMCLAPHLHWHP